MTSSEFVRLFKETPGATIGGEKASNRSLLGELGRALKANDYELIFAKEKERGEKTISFTTFLACTSVVFGQRLLVEMQIQTLSISELKVRI